MNDFQMYEQGRKEAENINDKTCSTCMYSSSLKHSCNRHLHHIKPDYSKGVECAYNGYVHYRPDISK